MLKEIRRGIKNLITWTPIIWKDQQWDHSYFFTILHKKLSLMEDFFRNRANFVGREKDAKKIKIATLLIDRLIKDDYMQNAFKDHEKRYGEMIWERETPFLLKYEKVKTKEDQIKCSKSFDRCANHEDYLRNQDLEFLFKLLKKNVMKWWD